jgi:type I restriction enzyme S subunit
MNYINFSQIFDFQKKSSIKAGDGTREGSFPFFTSSPILSKYSDSFQFDSPSLIFGTGGSASVHICETPFSVSTDCLVAQLKSNAVRKYRIKFVYYYLLGNIWILEKGFKGAGLRHISKGYINDIEIPELPLEEQTRIVKFLEKTHALRQKRNQAIELLDNYFKSVYLSMFGDPITNKKRWPMVELKDLCSEVIDCPHSTPIYSADKTDYPCIRSSDMQGGFLDFSTTKYIDEKQHCERIRRCKPIEGDIIYCREGARFGAVAYLPKDINASLGQRTMLFRVKPNIATSEFLWGLMNNSGISYQAAQLVNGAASPHINVKDIKQYKVFKPPLDLQATYSKIFLSSISIKQKMIAQSKELENQFQSLMQEAFKSIL